MLQFRECLVRGNVKPDGKSWEWTPVIFHQWVIRRTEDLTRNDDFFQAIIEYQEGHVKLVPAVDISFNLELAKPKEA